ncbi:MAG: hypothetical protein ACRDL8_05535 [Solirubrobacteraceae bacterium]
MIVWPAGHVNGTSLLVHENFHQWWGDNVSEGNFEMAFSKDGLAVLSQQLDRAHGWAQRAGGLNTTAGRAAFEQSLVRAFNSLYAIGRSFWKLAPSNRSPATYLDVYAAYQRPEAAYIALRQILGLRGFDAVLHAIQRKYGDSSITEPQLEAAFTARLPNHTAACQRRLSQFFSQWFDTAYHGSRPQITGPGQHGHSFYAHGCAATGGRR